MDSWGWVTSTILFLIILGAALGTHPSLVPVALTLHAGRVGKLGAHEPSGFFSSRPTQYCERFLKDGIFISPPLWFDEMDFRPPSHTLAPL
ncbi:hypothetical protein RU639_002219 [Aspergillus parasiticus]